MVSSIRSSRGARGARGARGMKLNSTRGLLYIQLSKQRMHRCKR